MKASPDFCTLGAWELDFSSLGWKFIAVKSEPFLPWCEMLPQPFRSFFPLSFKTGWHTRNLVLHSKWFFIVWGSAMKWIHLDRCRAATTRMLAARSSRVSRLQRLTRLMRIAALLPRITGLLQRGNRWLGVFRIGEVDLDWYFFNKHAISSGSQKWYHDFRNPKIFCVYFFLVFHCLFWSPVSVPRFHHKQHRYIAVGLWAYLFFL